MRSGEKEFHAKIFLAKVQRYFSQSREDATWRCCVFARDFQNRGTLALAGCDAELNRELNVQECDATMLKKGQMPETKV
ncbi:MAG TPA: hypothetical protein VK787_10470 [Puia sp.]|nr:hypothetical protein [Puia sp.]